jgi:hypothetical protein
VARRYGEVVTSIVASSMPPEVAHGGSSTVLVVLVVGALVAGCLFLLFRRGSIADRARRDPRDLDEPGPDQRR